MKYLTRIDCGDWEEPPATGGGQCTPVRLTRGCEVPSVYPNTPQTAVSDPCPEGTEGDVIEITVPAGTVNSPFSTEAANAVALASAQAQANALRVCTPSAISIDRQCQFKTETFDLPGHEEFTPSGSPKRYSTKTTSGTMTIQEFVDAACSLVYPGGGATVLHFPVFYFFNEYATGYVTAQLLSLDSATGNCVYVLSAADWVEDVPGGHLHRYPDPNIPITYFPTAWNTAPVIGVPFNVAAGNDFALCLNIQAVFGFGTGCGYYTAGNSTNEDVWDMVDTYNPDGSTIRSGQGTRTLAWGANVDISNENILTFYQGAHTIVWSIQPTYTSQVVTPTLKTVTGLGCVPGNLPWVGGGPGSMNGSGVVTEELANEVVPADVVYERTSTMGEWGEETSCDDVVASIVENETAFEYSYASKRVRASLGSPIPLEVGVEYTLTFKFARRIAGSSDPFVHIDENEVIVFTAVAPTETSAWVNYPNEVGFETMLEDITIE